MGDSGLPWDVANRWGNPEYDESDSGWSMDALGWLAAARSVLGLAVIIIVSWSTRPPLEVVEDEGWGKSVTNIAVALGVVPVLMVVVWLVNRGRDSGLRWWPVVWRVLLMFVTTFGSMAPIILFVQNTHKVDELYEWARDQGGWTPLIGLGLIALLLLFLGYALWVAAYVITVAMWALRTSLWSSAFHPLLAPVVTIVVVLITTAAQTLDADTKGLPHGTWLALTLGGLVTTIAVAGVEYAVLRRDGETWRR
jgi:hypothetical protein